MAEVEDLSTLSIGARSLPLTSARKLKLNEPLPKVLSVWSKSESMG